MKNVKLVLVACFIVSATIVSCSKGPTGPAGQTGATGATGTTGAQGPAGAGGIDTVFYSAWTTLTTTLDSVTINNGTPDSLFADTVSAPAITQSVLDSSVILSYIKNLFNTDSSILNTLSYGFLDVHYKVGEIDIFAPFDITGAQFRYVVIPGTILTQSATFKNYTKQQINAMDFATATRLLNQATGKSGSN